MKLLLDQGLPRSAVQALTAAGFDAAHVADLGMVQATDPEVLEQARADGRAVVTLDAVSTPSCGRLRRRRHQPYAYALRGFEQLKWPK